MMKKLFLSTITIILALCSNTYAVQMTMKTSIVSNKPFVVQEQFFMNQTEIANLKIRLDTGGDTGTKVQQRVIIEANGDIADGVYNELFPDGTIHFSKSYKNGLKDGPSKEMYPTGQVKRIVNYKAEKKQGPMQFFYPSGIMQKEINYIDNEYEGIQKNYTFDGRLESELTFERGEKEWYQTKSYSYHSNDKLRTEYFYDIRANKGYRKIFFENGQLHKMFIVDNGIMKDFNEYNQEGQMIKREDGPFNGILKSYYNNGSIMQEDFYGNGEIKKFKMYDLDGNVMFQ